MGLGAQAISGAGATTSQGLSGARIPAVVPPPAPGRGEDERAGLEVQPALGLRAQRSRGRAGRSSSWVPRMVLVGAGEPSEVPTPKTPRARQRGTKNKSAAKTGNTATAPGRKPRSKPPKKLEKEEEEGILQESPEEAQ